MQVERLPPGRAQLVEPGGLVPADARGQHLAFPRARGQLEALELLGAARPVLVVVNAREADGRDVSWLWDIPVESLAGRRVAVAGDRAADLGVRLSYGGVAHSTEPDPMAALERLPAGEECSGT